MEQEIKILGLVSGEILISQIEEVAALDIGQPDCKLTSPYKVDGDNISPWLANVTDDVDIMMCSDKILTLLEPHKSLWDYYFKLDTE